MFLAILNNGFLCHMQDKLELHNCLQPPNMESLFSIFLIVSLSPKNGSVLMCSVRESEKVKPRQPD